MGLPPSHTQAPFSLHRVSSLPFHRVSFSPYTVFPLPLPQGFLFLLAAATTLAFFYEVLKKEKTIVRIFCRRENRS